MSKEHINVILADNQPLTFLAISHLLSQKKVFKLISNSISASNLQELIRTKNDSLLIIDYNYEDFCKPDFLAKLIRQYPKLKVLVISSDNDKKQILKVLEAGVKGYITKNCSLEEIESAILAVSREEKFYCNKIFDLLLFKHQEEENENCLPTSLSARETEVLKLVAEGNSTQKIANDLNLSPHTINTHRKNIIKKLGIKSPTDFVHFALELGILKKQE
ncbi:LuxR C-terminal-related transcriptional regulator [Flexithrix dorotheae]|uniref:LuxR C-terminal-related transcriptional regulator n=1 Tax=Flexithrix dorotheae TaxID=70993 RepID=UPI00035FFA76|nr:response regulator transcription factor [Flexithrix dorotheae]